MTTEEIIKELVRYFPEAIRKIGEQIEAGGCGDCAFWDREEWEEPCRRCKRNCKDYWRKAESEEKEADEQKRSI